MNRSAKSFQDLVVWQKAHRFVLDVYRYTSGFPSNKEFCLTAQFRRAAVSVPANIAEGFKKKSKAEKIHYLNIAQGSLEECRYYLILAGDLHYGSTTDMMLKLEETSKLLESYATKISLSL
ncbi:MAG TPA: four helix bundle protein [Bacillota bacterium]|nr:four helix bundle protein [Bacillota bacterium]